MKVKDSANQGYLYKDLGDIFGEQGQHDRGLEFYEKSLSLFNPKMDLYNIANINMNMGVIYSLKKDWKMAAKHYEIAVEMTGQEGYINTQAWALFNLAEAYTKLKKLDAAEEALNRSAEMLEKTDDSMGLAGVSMKFGELYQEQGRWRVAFP